MSTMKPLMQFLSLLLVTSVSHAQDVAEPPSSLFPPVATSSTPSIQQTESRSPAPFSRLKATAETSFASTIDSCSNNPLWYVEEYDRSTCDWKKIKCDDIRVDCYEYGNLGLARAHCCKCKLGCYDQCNDTVYTFPPSNDDYTTCNDDDDPWLGNDDDDGESTTAYVGMLIPLGICMAMVLLYCNNEAQHSAQREATRQTMADRRQQQRQSNSQGLTEEERNHARYEKFVSKFYFQTVLPDKSNISAFSVRSLASKHDEEHLNDDENKNADASEVAASERSTKISLSRRLSSWRRPSAKDECCICLESYNVGETICAPITTECNHVFHEGCILQWVKNHDKCPLCRVDLLKD